jgi:plastocyanin
MRVALLAVLTALCVVGTARAADHAVAMPAKLFSPRELTVLVGDTVTWTNRDATTHNVVARDGTFSSGFLGSGEAFSKTFDEQGSFSYLCSIHRFMTGSVDVYSLWLSGPDDAVRPGGRATLTGLAPAGTPTVAIQARQGDGSFGTVALATPSSTGSFSAVVSPRLPTEYRAVAGVLESPPVLVSVSARLTLLVTGTRGAQVLLLAAATPSQAGARVHLERWVRERFTWAPVARARLRANSTAVFRITPKRRILVRVRLLEGVGGYGPSVSAGRWLRPGS